MTDYKLVPVEPTPEMVEAAEDAYMPFGDMEMALRMALLAAPAVQGEPVYLYRHRDLHDFITCNHERYAKLSAKPHLFETKVLYTAPQPAEQQPEAVREGAPYDDPAFSALCREHEVYGTAAAAQCAVFWEAGKRAAEQQPAQDVAKLQRKLEASFRREERLEAEVRELKREKFKKFRGEECWIWAGDGSDELETLMCPVVIAPADLMAIINRGSPAPDVEALVGMMGILVAAGNRLNAEAEECTYAGNMAEVAGTEYWCEFRDALETASAALAAHHKQEPSHDNQ